MSTVTREHLAGLRLAKVEIGEFNVSAKAAADYCLDPLIAQASAQPASVAVPEGYSAGVNAVAAMIDQKAEAYAFEFGHDDMGGLSFGQGDHAQVRSDYHQSLLELADEARAMLAAAPHPVSGEQKAEFFIDHDVLRKALGRCEIAGPESDSELGDRMAYYAKQVIRAVAKRDEPVAQDVAGLAAEVERISQDYEFRGPGCDAELAITEMREALVEALADWRKSHDS